MAQVEKEKIDNILLKIEKATCKLKKNELKKSVQIKKK